MRTEPDDYRDETWLILSAALLIALIICLILLATSLLLLSFQAGQT